MNFHFNYLISFISTSKINVFQASSCGLFISTFTLSVFNSIIFTFCQFGRVHSRPTINFLP
ncbi:TPA: hypothetical protein DCZ31_03270 [Patescibacteria group bacterium]|nr:hypothetical protein [Candidatus Gracilibacteria bacterium]